VGGDFAPAVDRSYEMLRVEMGNKRVLMLILCAVVFCVRAVCFLGSGYVRRLMLRIWKSDWGIETLEMFGNQAVLYVEMFLRELTSRGSSGVV
jgi:hypothetical protein